MDIRTITLSPRGQICIPKDVRQTMRLRTGEKLVMVADRNQLSIKRAKNVLKSISKESLWNMLVSEKTLKKDWDNKHDERWNKV